MEQQSVGVPLPPISSKTDPITALQDSIDLLSLSIFESLRQLRDAIDPTGATPSSTTTVSNNTNEGDQDNEDDDASSSSSRSKVKQRDVALVERLAHDVLEKSRAIVDPQIPGRNRTKAQQLKLIQVLMDQNTQLEQELDVSYSEALVVRERVREELRQRTCRLLGIDAED